MGSRNWVFTLNNPVAEPTVPKWIKLLVYQHEIGEAEGTPHIQGYLETTHSIRIQQLKNWLPSAHFERRRGSRRQALKYVTKEETRIVDTTPTLIGITETELSRLVSGSTTGNSTARSLERIQKKINDGASDLDIAEEFFDVWCKYHVALQKYRVMKSAPRNHVTEVIVLYGPTGTGKSKWAFDNYPDAYWKQRSNWWDGYLAHDTIIIDEFYGWLPYDLLLRLCDRYPLLLEIKGGQVQCVAKRVIFTTNNPCSTWYPNVRNIDAFKRRITKIMHLLMQGVISSYNDYNKVPW